LNILPPNPLAAGVASAACHETLSRESIGGLEEIEEVSTRFLGWINDDSDPLGQRAAPGIFLPFQQNRIYQRSVGTGFSGGNCPFSGRLASAEPRVTPCPPERAET